jgi:microcystin-dependent protein
MKAVGIFTNKRNKMKELITTNTGGHPAVLNDLRWSANGIYQAFQGMLAAFDPDLQNVLILSGCEQTINNNVITIQEGYVSFFGEICYVPAHSFASPNTAQKVYWRRITIYDNEGLKTYQNGSVVDTYAERIAKKEAHQNPPPDTYEAALSRNIYQIINKNIDSVPERAILMWSGAIGTIPTGYTLCDGQNGTPDLRGRFVLGVDPRSVNPSNGIWDPNYGNVGNTGGEKSHKLTVDEMPSHQHSIDIEQSTSIPSDPSALIIPNAFQGTGDYDPVDVAGATGSKGENLPHNNLPPYYVIAFIMKVGTFVPNEVDQQIYPFDS